MVRTTALLLGLIATAATHALPGNGRVVQGKVVDAVTRKPLAGAVVKLVADRSVQARADSSGVYRLPRVPVPGAQMEAAAEGYFSAVERIPPAAGGARTLPLFALRPASSLSGRVVDETGRPLAGADVRVFLDRLASRAAERKPHQTRTGAAGRFRLTGLAPGILHFLRVARPGFAPEILALTTPPAGPFPEMRLTLRRGRTATGLLADAAGRPAPGVTIELLRDTAGPDWETARADPGPYRDTTGPEGRFEIRDLPEGRFRVVARIPRDPVVELAHSVDIPGGPGRTDLGRQTLPPREVLEGRIFDSEGRPLEGVQVWTGMGRAAGDEQLLARHRAAGPAAVTDSDGRFALRSLDRRSGLWLCRAGFEPRFIQTLISRDLSRLALHPPAARPPGARVSGRVVDAEGRPVPGVLLRHGSFNPPGTVIIACGGGFSVESNPCKEAEDAPPPEPVSDADGRFSFEIDLGGAESSAVDVWTEAAGFLVDVRKEVPLAAGRATEIELILRPGAILTGRIVSPEGLPAAGAEVSARGERTSTQTVADVDGNYRLEGVEPGQGVLAVRHREHGEAHRKIEPGPGESRLDVTLDGKGFREIRGRVLDAGGEPLAGTLVELLHPLLGASAYTAGDGSFVLDYNQRALGGMDGSARVQATAKGHQPAVEDVILAGSSMDGLELRMERGFAITGRILGLEPGQDPRSVSGQARRGGDSQPGTFVFAGSYRIEDLGPGTWEVSASAHPWQSTGRVDLDGFSDEAVLDLEVPRLSEVRGRTLGPDGAPVRGVRILFQPLPPVPAHFSPSSFSGADGSFTLSLPEGLYEVVADAQGLSHTRLEQPLEVNGPISDLEIRLRTGTVLHGRVPGLRPGEASAKISANSGLATRWADTGPDGRYRLPDLGPGEWTVTAMLHQERVRRTGEGRIRLQPGEGDAILDLDLALGDLSLSLAFSSGEEPVSASLTLLRADGTPVIEGPWLDNEDSFRYTSLRPGRYRLQIQDNLHGRRIERGINLASDMEVVIDLREER
ncbi:MAG TPA: carboxypeptidase-like regulatory domain-containing protein [Thermoanaerobaculia bacterium]|nr:carboxypeptidase-like regulatory domain-containing protein [Thermoanaerobaculia bacterium]